MDVYSFMLDVECVGECPGLGNMVEFSLIHFMTNKQLLPSYAEFKALVAPVLPFHSSFTAGYEFLKLDPRVHESYLEPCIVMKRMADWLYSIAPFEVIEKDSKLTFRGINSDIRFEIWSDNNGFDFPWINFYAHKFLRFNPFGYSSRRIGDFYSGLMNKFTKQSEWKKFRVTNHTHDSLMDARGNVEAMEYIIKNIIKKDDNEG